jgi:uncharacterized protein YkwD
MLATRPPRARSRARLAALVLAAAVVLAGCLTAQQKQVADALNTDRRAAGLGNLPINDPAVVKAQAWAQRLADQNRLSHSDLASGMEGVCWRRLAENVGYGPSIASVERNFMTSPGHRANILGSWDAMGIGHATRQVSGQTRVFVVHVFVDLC